MGLSVAVLWARGVLSHNPTMVATLRLLTGINSVHRSREREVFSAQAVLFQPNARGGGGEAHRHQTGKRQRVGGLCRVV